MFCTNCGKEVPAGSKFCIHCGAPMAQQEPVNAPVEQAAAPQPQSVPQTQPIPQQQSQPQPQPMPQPYQQQAARPVQQAVPQQSAPQFMQQPGQPTVGQPTVGQPNIGQPMNGYPQAPVNFQKKKKGGAGKVIGIIAAVVVILAAVGIVSQTFLKNEAVRKFESAMAQQDYATAGSLINQIENGAKREAAIQEYLQEGENILLGYTSGLYSYEQASELLSTLSKNYPSLQVELKITQLENEKDAQEYFRWGEESESSGEYIDAVWDFELIEPDTALYAEAQKRIEALKEPYLAQVLERAEEMAQAGDYTGALQLLEEGERYSADSKLTEKRTEYEEAMSGGMTADGKYRTVEDFLNSDSVQSEISSLVEQMSGMGMDIRVHGEGSRLVYTYVYEDFGDSIDMELLSSLLEEALDDQSYTFESVAASLKDAVAVDNPSVVVEYLAPDGTVLCSREYFAN